MPHYPIVVTWLAQAQSLDPAGQYASLGVAGLICAVLTVVWRQAETRAARAETEVRELQRLRLEDRDKLLPLTEKIVTTLGGATIALETRERRKMDDTFTAIEQLAAELRERGKP